MLNIDVRIVRQIRSTTGAPRLQYRRSVFMRLRLPLSLLLIWFLLT